MVESPSINKTAFDCPHCGAFAEQTWHEVAVSKVRHKDKLPFFISREAVEIAHRGGKITQSVYDNYIAVLAKQDVGEVALDLNERIDNTVFRLRSLNLSKCYNCNNFAIWKGDVLLSPIARTGVKPNVDLPDEIVRDFNEARSIVDISPRGAAALLRLCIQKLCMHLGENSGTIDKDIASLVSKGLNPIIQKSLDAVRVIGNESVHPGEMNIGDDKDTALQLFMLVNLVAEQMISLPKAVDNIYNMLPESKRNAIDRRDSK